MIQKVYNDFKLQCNNIMVITIVVSKILFVVIHFETLSVCLNTRVGTLIVATIYLQLIQN